MSAMTAARVEHVGLGRGLGMGVDRRASGGRASAVPRARRHAVIARVSPGAGGTRSAVTRDRRPILITEEEEEEEDMSENAIVQCCSNLLPVSEEYDGDNFFTEVRNDETGEMIKMATPLLLCLCVIELSDVVFAVDSIPAVFGVTQDPFIVYSSNIFAILGLRSLFAFVAVMVAELEYLQTAVAAVLGFVGCKMVAEFGGVEVSTEASLAVVVGMLGAGVALSLAKKDDEEEGK